MRYVISLILCILCMPAFAAERLENSADAKAIKATVQALYKSIKFYEYDAMRDLVTPEYQMTFDGMRVTQPEFEAILRSGEVTYNPDEPPPLHRQYELVDFEIEVAGDVAFSRSTYTDKDPTTSEYYDLVVLRRDKEDDKRWRVHIHFHMAKAKMDVTAK